MSQWFRRRLAYPSSLLLLLPLTLPSAQGEAALRSEQPLVFVEHLEARPGTALFDARVPGLRAEFTATGFTLETGGGTNPERTTFRFEGARRDVRVHGVGALRGRVNRFVGSREDWIVGARTFQGIRYEGLYEGIDLEVRACEGRIEYDLFLDPGVDPQTVVVRCQGSDPEHGGEDGELRIEDDGSLVSSGAVVQRAPRSWQVAPDGTRDEVTSAFRLLGEGRFGFVATALDPARPLVIDPVFVYGAYVGGSNADVAWDVAVDSAGAVYVAGSSRSSDFPVGEEPMDGSRDGRDAVIFKLDATGSSLVWATYVGGTSDERALGIAVNPAGEVFVTGETKSDDFPATAAAHSTTRAGGMDTFVLSLAADGGALRFATYWGGSSDETGHGLALDGSDNVFVVGTTRSGDLPVTPHVFQTRRRGSRDAFVLKLDAKGSLVHYATYLGGLRDEEGFAVSVGPAGHAFVTGRTGSSDFPVTSGAFDESKADADAFVAKLSADGGALQFSTFLGGTRQDEGRSIAWCLDETIVVGGWTRSPDFPVLGAGARTTHAGRQDGFVARLTVSGGALVYSTLLGGEGADECLAVDVDASGTVWVTGVTDSDEFPVTGNAPQLTRSGGTDGFVARLDGPNGGLGWATYVGRGGDEVLWAVDVNDFTGEVAVAGEASNVPPLLRGEFGGRSSDSDALVTRIAPGACGAPATVEVLGGGAGATLSATLPRLGRTLTLTVSGGSAESEGVLWVGEEAELPVSLEGIGTWYLDRTEVFPLCAYETDAEGVFEVSIPIPPAAGLCGHTTFVQGFVVAPDDGPLVFGQITDAVRFTLGD